MNSSWRRGAARAAALAALLALGACGDRIEDTEMPLPGEANVEINRQDMEGAKDSAQAQGVAHDTTAMGAAPAPDDPDTRIAGEVRDVLAAHPEFGAAKVDVHSADGVVTLRGTAPDPAARDRAADIARVVDGVRSVQNELTLG